jgi:type IV secretion system protein VirB4
MKHTKDILKTLWQQENSVAEFIPYHVHLDENTIKTLGGDYLQVIKLDGIAYESANREDIDIYKEQLNLLLRNIASPHISLWTHTIRREKKDFAGGEFTDGFDKALNEKYASYTNKNKLMVNELYLTICYRPNIHKTTGFLSLFEKDKNNIQDTHAKALHHLKEIILNITHSLTAYNPSILSTYTHKGIVYSEVLEFLDFLINGEWIQRTLPKKPLNECLPRVRPLFGADSFELRGVVDTYYGACLGICDYPEETEAGYLNGLLSADFPFILTQSFQFLSKPVAIELLERQKNRLHTTQDNAVSQVQAIDDALDDLASHRLVFGEHHLVLTVFGKSQLALREHLANASSILVECAMIVAREDWGLAGAYWSQLPLNSQYRPRPAPITSRNFAALSGFHNFPQGQKSHNQWGDAVTMFNTASNGAYFFNFHEPSGKHDGQHRALGNTLIIGPSGSGKTVIQGFLMSQSRKFKPRQVIFDKDRGLEIYVRASGGRYLTLKNGDNTGFNPFHLEHNTDTIVFLTELLKTLCGGTLTVIEESDIDRAVRAVMKLPFEMRSLSRCLEFLDTSQIDGVHAKLSKWSRGQSLGWVFDNPVDRLDIQSHSILGFDVTDFLDNPEVRTPIMMYLFHRIDSVLNGEPIQIFIDEFWKLLTDNAFERFAQNKQKVIRKQNGIMIYGTQSAKDVLQSPIAHSLIEQCATFIFMPNPRAQTQDYQEGFHLTDREFQLVKEEMPPRHFLIKQAGQSVVVKLDLQGFSDELAIISGTTRNVILVEEIMRVHGNNPQDWMPIFQQKRKEIL